MSVRDSDQDAATVALERRKLPEAHGVRLEVVAGADRGRSAETSRRKVVVGRSSGADFQLNDRTVSAFHVALAAVEGGIEVRDLESSNGVLHAGARILHAVVPPGAVLKLGATQLRLELAGVLEAAPRDAASFGSLKGTSLAMRELFDALGRLAKTELSVLVQGPTGTGKELAARALHAASARHGGPFVVLDCTTIPATLAESVLFGHEKRAFTGATDRHRGVFEAADGGTVFLDEIGELPSELQPKLLRVLEQRQLLRVGSTQPRPVDVRVVSATWRDLRAAINKNRFREDLYHRLAQALVEIPGLEERREDISLLVDHVLDGLPRDKECARAIDAEAMAELRARPWPGNVRELRNVVERAAWTALSDTIRAADLAFGRRLAGERRPPGPSQLAADDGGIGPFKEAKRTLIDDFEREYLKKLFARTQGNISKAATLAGVERHYIRTLYRKHGLRSDDE